MAHSHRLSCDVPSMVSCCVYLLVLCCPVVQLLRIVDLNVRSGVMNLSLWVMRGL